MHCQNDKREKSTSIVELFNLKKLQMKKYSKDAHELLSTMELFEIKAGSGEQFEKEQPAPACGLLCATCVGCSSSCTACTTVVMVVIP